MRGRERDERDERERRKPDLEKKNKRSKPKMFCREERTSGWPEFYFFSF
jgi:hypothetical protein